MEIVNVSWIYWFNMIHILKILSIAFAVVSGIVSFILIICFLYDGLDKHGKKWLKIILCAGAFSLMLIVVLPSRETMLMMLIAEHGNAEEVSDVITAIKEAADNIINTLSASVN